MRSNHIQTTTPILLDQTAASHFMDEETEVHPSRQQIFSIQSTGLADSSGTAGVNNAGEAQASEEWTIS